MISYIRYKDLDIDSGCVEKIKCLYQYYIQHQFDLLGSGFVTVNYQLEVKGMCGHKYVDQNMKIFDRIAKKRLCKKCRTVYMPINWFIDYKSGFFFNPVKYNSLEKCQTIIGRIPGVDIKCPWELGRFYHLVQLAVLATAEMRYRNNIIIEFRDELMDFWAMNPIGKTVQWSAPMDVSIRMVNLLVTYDILKQIDDRKYLDREFGYKFEKHIYDSLKFVMNHLEYGRKGAGTNHYLSNIVGIIFAAAYLPSEEWTDACLVFGVQELIDQTEKQFYKDGSNFEGSTSYHRLSAEFVLYSTALIYGVLKTRKREVFGIYNSSMIAGLRRLCCQKYNIEDKDFFPKWYLDRLCNMGMFTKTILKGNNEIVQIGDNDSGRLLKLTPMIKAIDTEIKDNVIDHRTLLSVMSGLFDNDVFADCGREFPLENSFIHTISGFKKVVGEICDVSLIGYGNRQNIFKEYQYKKETVIYETEEDKKLLEGLEIYYFRQFEIVIVRSKRMFLSMVIDTAQETKYINHTHNDKLSIELMVDGKYITRDPGGYIYTASPDIRDKFRSVNAHNVIHIKGVEQNIFVGTFGMQKRARAQLLYCRQNNIIASAEYNGIIHIREIVIEDNRVVVIDYSNNPFTVSFHNRIYSMGYGELEGRN